MGHGYTQLLLLLLAELNSAGRKKMKVKLLLVFFYAFLCISMCLADISIFLRCRRRAAFAAARPKTLYEIHHFLETPFLRSMLEGDFSRKTNAVCNKW